MRKKFRATVLFAATMLTRSTAWADTVETWNGGTGSWTTASYWSGSVVPNGTTYAAVIDANPSVSSVAKLGNATVNLDSLTLTSGDSLWMQYQGTLLATSFDNSGTLNVYASAYVTVGTLTMESGSSLNAGGQPVNVTTLNSDAGSNINVSSGNLVVATLDSNGGAIELASSAALYVSKPYVMTASSNIQSTPGASLSFQSLALGVPWIVPAGISVSVSSLTTNGNSADVSGTGTISNLVNSGGQITLNNAAAITGSGTWNNSGGSVVVNDTASLLLNSNGGNFSGGSISVAPTATVTIPSSPGGFNLTSGTISLGSSNGGTFGGVIQNNGTLNIVGKAAISTSGLTLSGNGTFNYSANWGLINSPGPFVNYATLTATGNCFILAGAGSVNHGTIQVVPAVASNSSLTFSGDNAVDGTMIVAPSQALDLRGNNAGVITVNSGADLTFGDGFAPAPSYTSALINNSGILNLRSVNVTADKIVGTGTVLDMYFDSLVVNQITCGALNVSAPSFATLTAQPAGSAILAESVGALYLDFSPLTVSPALSSSSRIVLEVSSITYDQYNGSSHGLLALGNNDLIVHSGDLSATTASLASGCNGGQWNGANGIASASATADTNHLTALGSMLNSNPDGSPIFFTFDGQLVAATDVLVKYTYWGDANLDGKVDGSDYSRIDFGFLNQATGWENGDFNYDGLVNGSDYTLIDNAFNSQGGSLADIEATTTAQISTLTTVPEPTTAAMAFFAAISLARRNGRKPCPTAAIASGVFFGALLK